MLTWSLVNDSHPQIGPQWETNKWKTLIVKCCKKIWEFERHQWKRKKERKKEKKKPEKLPHTDTKLVSGDNINIHALGGFHLPENMNNMISWTAAKGHSECQIAQIQKEKEKPNER